METHSRIPSVPEGQHLNSRNLLIHHHMSCSGRLGSRRLQIFALIWLVLLLPGCGSHSGQAPSAALKGLPANRPPEIKVTDPATPLPPTQTSTPASTPAPTSTWMPLPPALTPTPDKFAGLRITDLIVRSYGGGQLLILKTLSDNIAFTRYLVAYPSDGLNIFGFMNVPKKGQGPYPVVIAVHGFVDPSHYQTLDYTTSYADSLARAGFLVIHPNLRGYAPSDNGPNLYRVGMAVDVLNLVAIVRQQGGKPGDLQQACPDDIGLWGHSMGGGITLKVITVDPGIKAAVLYGAMSGDERQNFEAILRWSGGAVLPDELIASEQVLAQVSPSNYLNLIQAAVSIHHGESDPLVPLHWSLDFCSRLKELHKTVECFTYPEELHTFSQEGDVLFMQRVIDFFHRTLDPTAP